MATSIEKTKLPARCIHRAPTQVLKDGQWEYRTEDRLVVLMAISGKWAMVRRPRAAPYACPANELAPLIEGAK
jgi:hypothetical protein